METITEMVKWTLLISIIGLIELLMGAENNIDDTKYRRF